LSEFTVEDLTAQEGILVTTGVRGISWGHDGDVVDALLQFVVVKAGLS